ncbi:MAG: IS3 family transposase [Cyclobacteriaceae bacterium]
MRKRYSKKGCQHLLQGRRQVYEFIMKYHVEFGVERMCRVFRVSRSGYYDWQKRKPSTRQIETEEITAEIRRVYKLSKNRYGSPKITNELVSNGWKISRPRVARIMRFNGMRSIISKKFKVNTTDSSHDFPVVKNHLNREFTALRPAEKWVSDITYISTAQCWLYLTIVMDLFDRKIIGWSLSTDMTTENSILSAWKMAILNRPITQQLIFHSDRGVQYASHIFRVELEKHSVIQSMSRKGNCWDNAVAENYFKILKSEMVYQSKYISILQAKSEIFEFIEIWYNRQRKHSYLGYRTPDEYSKTNYSKCA